MGKSGVIAVIPKNFDHAFPTMEKSLREKGMSMFPGTFKMYFPYKERNGYRRTGLDPQAPYIKNIKDADIQKQEIARVSALKDDLEKKTGLDLNPESSYWDKIFPVKLGDTDNIFDLENPDAAIQFAWLRVHPLIASSYDAYLNGEYPSDTHFYVKDGDVEAERAYKKNKGINESITKIESLSLPKRRKVARLVGLSIDEDTREEIVYNALSDFIRENVVKDGPYQGQDSVSVFKSITSLSDDNLEIRDTVNTSILKNIYREGAGGLIMEGTAVRWKSRTEMVNFFLDPNNQEALLELIARIKVKQ